MARVGNRNLSAVWAWARAHRLNLGLLLLLVVAIVATALVITNPGGEAPVARLGGPRVVERGCPLLALRLRERRVELGIEVKTITDRLGFTRNYWSAVENERKILSAEKLAQLLDVLEFDKDEKAELLDLREAARRRGWWAGYSLPGRQNCRSHTTSGDHRTGEVTRSPG